MLSRILLSNFRGFVDHELPVTTLTLIVGRNNAGKSTIIEALRFIALATARYRTLTYVDPPEEYDIPARTRGISPALREFNFDRQNLFYRYGDPPAIITAEFDNIGSIVIYIFGADDVFIVVKDQNDQIIRTAQQARNLKFPHINILPPLIPVSDIEERLNETYVRRSLSTSRSSIHFRNELLILGEYSNEFRNLCESNWPHLQIRELLTGCGDKRNELQLHIRDEDFVGEVRWMGHGLQIWLQTMWFLARVAAGDTVVLDEPDVFLHADLQRKLIRILKRQNRQSIIATHSIEMMAEVEPSSILVVDRRHRRSEFATSLPAVQEVIEHIGGIHNIQLARLWSQKKIIYVEGDDVSF